MEQGGAAISPAGRLSARCRRRRMAGPLKRRSREQQRRVARAPADGQDRARSGLRRRAFRCSHRPAALEPAPPARCRGPDPFHRADRLACGDRLRGRAGTDGVDPRAGIVRARRNIRPSPAAACPSPSNCCRRRTGRCRSRAICPASGAAAMPRCAPKCAGAIPSTPGPTIHCRRRPPAAPSRAGNSSNCLEFRNRPLTIRPLGAAR